jgi:hypothetical protein
MECCVTSVNAKCRITKCQMAKNAVFCISWFAKLPKPVEVRNLIYSYLTENTLLIYKDNIYYSRDLMVNSAMITGLFCVVNAKFTSSNQYAA